MDKRFITFFAVALPIYLLGVFYVQRQQKDYRAKLAAYEAGLEPRDVAYPWHKVFHQDTPRHPAV